MESLQLRWVGSRWCRMGHWGWSRTICSGNEQRSSKIQEEAFAEWGVGEGRQKGEELMAS